MVRVLDALGRSVARWLSGSLAAAGGPPMQDATSGAQGVIGLEELIEQTERQRQLVQSALRRFGIPKAWRETARLLVLGDLLSELATLSRLLRRTAPLPDSQLVANLKQTLARLQQLIEAAEGGSPKDGFYRHAYRETGWELVLELRLTLLELGDACYLATVVQEEQQLDQQRDREPEAKTVWSDLFDSAELHELLGALRGGGEQSPTGTGQPAVRCQAVEMLTRLYQERSDADRKYRVQEMLRVARVRWTCWGLGPAMLGLAVLYIFILNRDLPDWRAAVLLVGLALVPAALGGMLGTIRRLRQDPLVSRSGEQPRYRWAFVAQILISGTLGLIVLALAVLQILPAFQVDQNGEINWLDSQNLVILSLYTFVAGFSEAFALNFLQRFVTSGAV